MLPTIQIGPLNFQAPALFMIVAFIIGVTLVERFSSYHAVSADTLTNLIYISLIAGIITARLFFIIGNASAFSASPLNIFSPNPAMLDAFGGFAGALLAGLVYGRKKSLPLWATLDALTPLFSLVMVGLGFSHFASGKAFGAETALPWAIHLWGVNRHPSQVYEIIAAVFTLGLLWQDFKKPGTAGMLFLKFTAFTSGWLLFLEAFRGDSILLFGKIRKDQMVNFLTLAASLIGLEMIAKRSHPAEIIPAPKGEL